MHQWISSAYLRFRPVALTAIALVGAIAAAVGTGRPALAAMQDISSAGPLTHIWITDTLNCQVSHSGDGSFEFYPPGNQIGACGTFVVVGGTLYGFFDGGATGSASPRVVFTPVSQSAVLGTGTAADPYRIVTVVAAGITGITLTETDSYVVGQEVYRTDVQLANAGASAQPVRMYRAGDCFLQNSDLGFGRAGPGGAIACTADTTPNSRIEQWVPITGGSHYYETFYDTGWAKIGSKQPFPDTCDCSSHIDNWAGLSWDVSVPAASSITVSHLTVFSPLGVQPLMTAKTADSPTAVGGTADGYTITVTNPNISPVTLNSIFDDLPAGFTYTAGSTTGVTTADPAVAAQHLMWTGPFTVPANGSVSLHFGVTVSLVPGDYFDNAGGDAGSTAVAPTGPTAKITVTSPADAQIAATGAAVSATEGIAFSGTVATFTDPDTAATASEYSATIAWGDGSTSAGTVSGSTGGPFTVSGTHTYADEGTFTTTVVIQDTDKATNSATATGTATVADAALTPGAPVTVTATEGSAFSGTVGSFSDANPGATTADFTATINWGDGSPPTAGVVSGPAGGPFTVSGSHTYAEEGSYTISVAVTDDGGSTATLTATATVADASLSGSCATPVVSGTAYAGATATFTDHSASGTLTDFSATINWGDGSSSAGVITGGPGTAPYTVSGTHTYATAGFYVITTTITDVGGSSVTVTCSNQTFVFPPSTAGCDIDGAGRIKAANGDKAKFTVDAEVASASANTDDEDGDDDEDNHAPENVQTYRDFGPATPFGFQSTQLLAVTCNDHTSGSIYGSGTVNGTTPVNFIIDVTAGSREDSSVGRHSRDDEEGSPATYRIRLSNGYDSGTQNVRGGRIQIEIESDHPDHHDGE